MCLVVGGWSDTAVMHLVFNFRDSLDARRPLVCRCTYHLLYDFFPGPRTFLMRFTRWWVAHYRNVHRSNWAVNSKAIGIGSQISDVEEGYQESKFPTDLYEHLEGRNYCRKPDKKSYFLPCDDEEIDRLQINHLMFKWVSLFLSLSPSISKVSIFLYTLAIISGPSLEGKFPLWQYICASGTDFGICNHQETSLHLLKMN